MVEGGEEMGWEGKGGVEGESRGRWEGERVVLRRSGRWGGGRGKGCRRGGGVRGAGGLGRGGRIGMGRVVGRMAGQGRAGQGKGQAGQGQGQGADGQGGESGEGWWVGTATRPEGGGRERGGVRIARTGGRRVRERGWGEGRGGGGGRGEREAKRGI